MPQAPKVPVKLSKAAKKRHVASGGDGECPFCRTEDNAHFNYQDFEPMEGGVLEQRARCDNCHREWVDVYQLKAVFSVNPDTGARD